MGEGRGRLISLLQLRERVNERTNGREKKCRQKLDTGHSSGGGGDYTATNIDRFISQFLCAVRELHHQVQRARLVSEQKEREKEREREKGGERERKGFDSIFLNIISLSLLFLFRSFRVSNMREREREREMCNAHTLS